MNPMMPGSLMPLQMSGNAMSMQDDSNSFNYFFSGPMQLPPSSNMPSASLVPPSASPKPQFKKARTK